MLSDSKVFLAIGGVLVILGFGSFLAVAILKVMSGHSLDVYYNPRLGPIPYVVAVATIVGIALILIFVGVLRFAQWYRQRRAVTPNNRWRGP
jgi:hypothetical protein